MERLDHGVLIVGYGAEGYAPYALNPKPQSPNPKLQTLNPDP